MSRRAVPLAGLLIASLLAFSAPPAGTVEGRPDPAWRISAAALPEAPLLPQPPAASAPSPGATVSLAAGTETGPEAPPTGNPVAGQEAGSEAGPDVTPGAGSDLIADAAASTATLTEEGAALDAGSPPGLEAAQEAAQDPGPPGDLTPDPVPQPGVCVGAPTNATAANVVFHGARTRKVVALTFDDGWNPTNTLKILAILERARVNATFFPVGRAIESAPTAWQAVVAGGFPIADHTYDHARLAGRCYTEQLTELTRQSAIVRTTLGVLPLPVMRPPGGAFDGLTPFAAQAADQRAVVLWDVDTRDWTGLGSRAIATRALGGRAGSIILMHTFPPNTAAALPAIIAGYRARGYDFVTVGTLLGMGGAVPFP